jgi:hypothetical protein
MFKIIVLFYNNAVFPLYVRVGMLLPCGKHLHDLLISLIRRGTKLA